MRIQRPGDKIIHIPGGGMGYRHRGPRGGAAAGNWWEAGGATGCLVAYQPKGAASYAASLSNLANPGTYDATEGTAPAWAALTGWTFDGSNDFLTSGLAGNNTYSMIVQYSGAIAQTGAIAGLTDGTAVRLNIYPKYTDGNTYLRAGGSSTTTAPAGFAAGNFCVTPAQGYWNGSTFGSALSGAYSGSTSWPILIGAHNNRWPLVPTAGNYWAGNILALAIYNDTLTAPEVSAIAAAMAAL